MEILRNLSSRIPGAPSFIYNEFVKSETAIRLNIVNNPNEEQWQCIEKLAVNVLQPLRNVFGAIKISSGFRSVALCNAVGSNSFSNHAKGQAADIEPYDHDITLMMLANFIHDKLNFQELILEYFPNGWVHVAYRENVNEKEIKLKDPTHNYTRMSWNDIISLY